jgi:hypothetical protein
LTSGGNFGNIGKTKCRFNLTSKDEILLAFKNKMELSFLQIFNAQRKLTLSPPSK